MRDRHASIACLSAALLVALVGTGSAAAQDPTERPRTKVFTPESVEGGGQGMSTNPQHIRPQLEQSLALQERALRIVLNAGSEEELREAAKLTLQAYFFQRAAHGGIMKLDRANTRPSHPIKREEKVAMASRQNLTAAQNDFKNAKFAQRDRIERGLDFLRAAISQTNEILGTHH